MAVSGAASSGARPRLTRRRSVERVSGAPATGTDDEYYFGPRPVALVELYAPTKLPVWPGKFAACNPDR